MPGANKAQTYPDKRVLFARVLWRHANAKTKAPRFRTELQSALRALVSVALHPELLLSAWQAGALRGVGDTYRTMLRGTTAVGRRYCGPTSIRSRIRTLKLFATVNKVALVLIISRPVRPRLSPKMSTLDGT